MHTTSIILDVEILLNMGRLGVWKRKRYWTFQTCDALRQTPGTRCWTAFWEPGLTMVGRST